MSVCRLNVRDDDNIILYSMIVHINIVFYAIKLF